MSTQKILQELLAGNQRFVRQELQPRTKKPADLAKSQRPRTIVLTCADSRVPPELIFDQDLGDLFVIRIAGNIASDEAVASIEYAVSLLGSSLCMVLGHTNCGAAAAAVEYVLHKKELPSPCLQKLVNPIAACVPTGHSDHALEKTIVANIQKTVLTLQEKSAILKQYVQQGKLEIIGAQYQLENGSVELVR